MNRRDFLSRFVKGAAAVAATAVALPEALLWEPKKTFFLPPAGGWTQDLYFHKHAFSFVMDDVTLAEFKDRYIQPAAQAIANKIDADARGGLLTGGTVKDAEAYANQVSIRMVKEYDAKIDNMPCRLDALYGFAKIKPEYVIKFSDADSIDALRYALAARL